MIRVRAGIETKYHNHHRLWKHRRLIKMNGIFYDRNDIHGTHVTNEELLEMLLRKNYYHGTPTETNEYHEFYDELKKTIIARMDSAFWFKFKKPNDIGSNE